MESRTGSGGRLQRQSRLWRPRYDRRHRGPDDPSRDTSDRRTPGQKDRDRILYASAFRRLAGITQVVAPTEGHVFHNRLTHTLEVAQIGRRLAEKLLQDHGKLVVERLGGIDPDVVEAGAMAHDLGHPPFGHIAESELQSILDDHPELPGSFEGNAQSFRIITKLAVHRYLLDSAQSYPGLDLTRATLNAMLKYPCTRFDARGKPRRKWGVYESEVEDFHWARRSPFDLGEQRSVEAELMDWADDVAYSVHDLEDFYRAGLIPLDRLSALESGERDRFLNRAIERRQRDGRNAEYDEAGLNDAFTELITSFPVTEPYYGSRQQRGDLRRLTANLIGRYIGAVRLRETGSIAPSLIKDRGKELEVVMLKELTWDYVVNNPALATHQRGQRHMIRTLFEVFYDAARTWQRWSLFPQAYREELGSIDAEDATRRTRTVVDFIASRTEQEAVNLYQRVTGHSSRSILERLGY